MSAIMSPSHLLHGPWLGQPITIVPPTFFLFGEFRPSHSRSIILLLFTLDDGTLHSSLL